MKSCKLYYICIILLGLSVILCTPIYAYQIKYYDAYGKVDRNYCEKIISSIPIKYTKDYTFAVYHYPPILFIKHYAALSYPGKLITLFQECKKEEIEHELAHKLQIERFGKQTDFTRDFYNCLEEIKNASF